MIKNSFDIKDIPFDENGILIQEQFTKSNKDIVSSALKFSYDKSPSVIVNDGRVIEERKKGFKVYGSKYEPYVTSVTTTSLNDDEYKLRGIKVGDSIAFEIIFKHFIVEITPMLYFYLQDGMERCDFLIEELFDYNYSIGHCKQPKINNKYVLQIIRWSDMIAIEYSLSDEDIYILDDEILKGLYKSEYIYIHKMYTFLMFKKHKLPLSNKDLLSYEKEKILNFLVKHSSMKDKFRKALELGYNKKGPLDEGGTAFVKAVLFMYDYYKGN